MTRPLRGKREILETAYVGMRGRLIATCRPIVGDDAEDVVQDAYLHARAHLEQLRDPSQIDAWLMRIALNECFTRQRRLKRWLELLPLTLASRPSTSDPDVRDAVERLPLRERGFVVLRYGYGLMPKEIAHLLDMRESTVRSILFRARRTLRAWLLVDEES